MNKAKAIIKGNSKHPNISGSIKFEQIDNEVKVVIDIKGLPESQFLGFHIHNKGECSGNEKDEFKNVGKHYNPSRAQHPDHAGDLTSIYSSNGSIHQEIETDRLTVNEMIGKAIIIHSQADDFKSQPAGDAGDKIACGEIIEDNLDNEGYEDMKFLKEDKDNKQYSIINVEEKTIIDKTDDFVDALVITFNMIEPEDYEEKIIIKDNVANKYIDYDELEEKAKDYFNYLKRKEKVVAFGKSDYAEMDMLENILEDVFGVTFADDYYDEALKQNDIKKADRLRAEYAKLDKEWDKADDQGQPTAEITKEMDRVSKQLDEDTQMKKCALCGKEFKGYGNNGQPLVDGTVCDDCNVEVIKARLSAKDKTLDESSNQLKDMADEAKKKQKGLGAFVKMDAGNVEQNIATFNKNMTPNIGTEAMVEEKEWVPLDPETGKEIPEREMHKKFNITAELTKMYDEDPDLIGSILSMYDMLEDTLSIDEKKQIVRYILMHDLNAVDTLLWRKRDEIDRTDDVFDLGTFYKDDDLVDETVIEAFKRIKAEK